MIAMPMAANPMAAPNQIHCARAQRLQGDFDVGHFCFPG